MTPEEKAVRDRLADRRERLAAAAAESEAEGLVELLRRVDSALGRLEGGEWTICVDCQVPVEPELLELSPEVRLCFDCLSPQDLRALERDLEGAARVQRALLPPRHMAHDGWEMASLWEPKGAVSGDHVDVLPPAVPAGPNGGPEPCHLILGDVVGKGVAASLLQAHLHALFRALLRPDESMGEIVGRANRLFAAATGSASYASLIAARLFPDGALELANAGHPPPLFADRRGVRPVEGAGLPLGLFPASTYTSRHLRMEPGQVILLYTDGWTEAARGEEELGVGRAAAAFRRAATLGLPDLLAACREAMETFLDGTPRGDDLTLLAIRRTG